MFTWKCNNQYLLLYQQEFWFTAIITFLYFTAFTAMLADFAITAEDPDEQYWYDAQVAAGVSFINNYELCDLGE